MNGIKVGLLDTNILIYRSKGLLDFRAIAARYDKLYVSWITYMEAFGFDFKNPAEMKLMEALFSAIEIVQTDMDIARKVVEYRRIRKVKIPDAIILASAKKLGAELVTFNEDDFRGLDLQVSIFVPAVVLP